MSQAQSQRCFLQGTRALAPGLLLSIGMKAGQQSCLIRYLNSPPAAAGRAAAAPSDPEAAALDHLKSFFAAAGVVLAHHYEAIAQRLIAHGVADGISLRDSIASSPPCFRLEERGREAGANTQNHKHLDPRPIIKISV
jgi:hypothetical protein